MKKIFISIAITTFAILMPLFGDYRTTLIKLPTTSDLITNDEGISLPNIYYGLNTICTWRNILFSAGAENCIKSWWISDNGQLTLKHEYKEAHASAFCGETITALSSNESMLISAGFSRQMRLWRIADYSGRLELLYAISRAHQECIRAICFYENNIFFSASDDGSIKSWNINSNHEFEEIENYEKAHDTPIRCMTIYKNNLISISVDDIIRIWEITEQGQLLLTSFILFNKHEKILDALCTYSGFLVIKFLETEQQFSTKVWQLDDEILRVLTSENVAHKYRINQRSNCPIWDFNCLACNPPSKLTYYGNIIFSLENQFWIEADQIVRQTIQKEKPPRKTRRGTLSRNTSVKSITNLFKTGFKFK